MTETEKSNNSEPACMPEPYLPAVIPTLNGRGFMFDTLDPYSRSFADFAGKQSDPALDIGCAYGVATLPALEAGAHVVACDMEQGHLDVLTSRVPEEQRDRLTTQIGTLPDVDFEAESFSAILSSRLFHFLTGDEVEQSVTKMFRWLKPGGKLFLVVDSPYMPPWNKLAPVYEEKKASGEPWPGFIADYSPFLGKDENAGNRPPFMNPLDPDILERVCSASGFVIEHSVFFGLQRDGVLSNGKEHTACIAVKSA